MCMKNGIENKKTKERKKAVIHFSICSHFSFPGLGFACPRSPISIRRTRRIQLFCIFSSCIFRFFFIHLLLAKKPKGYTIDPFNKCIQNLYILFHFLYIPFTIFILMGFEVVFGILFFFYLFFFLLSPLLCYIRSV